MKHTLKKVTQIRNKPLNISQEDEKLFSHEYKKILKKTKVKLLKNVYIDQSKLKKYKYFRFHVKQWRMNPLSFKEKIIFFIKDLVNFFGQKGNKDIYIIPKATWVVDSRTYQYFHWFTDGLQRIEVSKEQNQNYPVILLPGFDKFNYITDSLEILGIKYLVLEKNKTYLVKNLILSERVSPAGNFRKSIIQKVSENLKLNFKYSEKSKSYSRIWISRQLATKRKISNFGEIIPILEKHNFKIIEFETISFSDQVEILKNCEILGGLHGAGHTNMLFMLSNSLIIEVRGDNDNKNNCFFSLSSDLENNYSYFLAKPTSENFYDSDYKIDTKLFDEYLNNIVSEFN